MTNVVDLTGAPVNIAGDEVSDRRNENAWEREPRYCINLPDCGELKWLSLRDLVALASSHSLRPFIDQERRKRGGRIEAIEYDLDEPALPEAGALYVELPAAKQGYRCIWRFVRSYVSPRGQHKGKTICILSPVSIAYGFEGNYLMRSRGPKDLRITLEQFRQHYRRSFEDESEGS